MTQKLEIKLIENKILNTVHIIYVGAIGIRISSIHTENN